MKKYLNLIEATIKNKKQLEYLKVIGFGLTKSELINDIKTIHNLKDNQIKRKGDRKIYEIEFKDYKLKYEISKFKDIRGGIHKYINSKQKYIVDSIVYKGKELIELIENTGEIIEDFFYNMTKYNTEITIGKIKYKMNIKQNKNIIEIKPNRKTNLFPNITIELQNNVEQIILPKYGMQEGIFHLYIQTLFTNTMLELGYTYSLEMEDNPVRMIIKDKKGNVIKEVGIYVK